MIGQNQILNNLNDYQNRFVPLFTYSNKILFANPAAIEYFGAKQLTEISDYRIEDFSSPIQPDGQRVDAKIEYALSTAQKSGKSNIRIQFVIQKIQYKYADVTVIKLPECFLFVLHDVTSYIQRENELLYRINRLERAISTGSDAIWQYNTTTNSFFFFPSLLKMLGYKTNRYTIPVEELTTIIYPQDRKDVKQIIKNFTNPSFHEQCNDIRLKNSEGKYNWFRFRGTLESTDNYGTPITISGTSTNIELQKQNEIRIKQNEENLLKQNNLLEILLYNMPVGLYMIEYKTRTIIRINQKAIEILGYDNTYPNQINANTHKHWVKANTNQEYPLDKLPITTAFRTSKFAQINDLEIIKNNGERISVQMTASPLLDTNKNIWAVLVSAIDITESVRKTNLINQQNIQYQKLNEELRLTNINLIEANQRAEESDRLKTSFLENLSHELRTPMNGIIGFSDLLKDSDINNDDKNLYIDIIRNSATQLLGIVSDIMEISKIDTGQVSVRIENVNIYKIVVEVYTIIKNHASQKSNLSFFIDCSPECKDIIIVSDEVKLKQIFTNLINNAIKYTEQGFVKIQLHLDGNFIVFSVEDSGCGIIKENIPLIFRRFVRLKDSDNIGKTHGTGLGLSIAKSYVELLGGTIDVESTYGKGSKFSVKIPIKANSKN